MKAKTLIVVLVSLLALGCLILGCKKEEAQQAPVSQDTNIQEEQPAAEQPTTDESDVNTEESAPSDTETDEESY